MNRLKQYRNILGLSRKFVSKCSGVPKKEIELLQISDTVQDSKEVRDICSVYHIDYETLVK